MNARTRRFERIEGASTRFWEVRQDGASLTVWSGRVGETATSRTTSRGSPDAAAQEVAALIQEKVGEGYHAVSPTETWRPPAPISTGEHVRRFLNHVVTPFNPAGDDEVGHSLRELDRRAYSVAVAYDDVGEDPFPERLQALLDDPKVGELRALVIGPWFTDYDDDGPTKAVELLWTHASRLRALRGIFLGDIVQEEAEISWIRQVDWGPTLSAMPQLEHVVLRGGEGLRLTRLTMPALQSLTIQTGGLPREVLLDVLAADLPELRSLTLWLGDGSYGGTCKVADLEPLLAGRRFPRLEHLGLQDSPEQDAIAAAVAGSALLPRLKGLDLSMGTLSDLGGAALLDKVAGLRWLNLRYNFLSPAMARRLSSACPEVDVSGRSSEGPDDRYVEVSE